MYVYLCLTITLVELSSRSLNVNTQQPLYASCHFVYVGLEAWYTYIAVELFTTRVHISTYTQIYSYLGTDTVDEDDSVIGWWV